MSEKLLPPPRCFTRDEGSHTVISGRVVAGPVAIMATVFLLIWSCGAIFMISLLLRQASGGQKVPVTVNGVPKGLSLMDVLVFLVPIGIMVLVGVMAAAYLWFGRVTARLTRDEIEIFTGVAGIGRRMRVNRDVVRAVTVRNSGIRVSGRPPLKVIELVGSDVTTGLMLGTSGREWFAQELRARLGIEPVAG